MQWDKRSDLLFQEFKQNRDTILISQGGSGGVCSMYHATHQADGHLSKLIQQRLNLSLQHQICQNNAIAEHVNSKLGQKENMKIDSQGCSLWGP